jgi:hypothetical protein
MAAFASWLGVMPAAKKVDLTCVRQADEFPPSVMSLSCGQIEFLPEWQGLA